MLTFDKLPAVISKFAYHSGTRYLICQWMELNRDFFLYSTVVLCLHEIGRREIYSDFFDIIKIIMKALILLIDVQKSVGILLPQLTIFYPNISRFAT